MGQKHRFPLTGRKLNGGSEAIGSYFLVTPTITTLFVRNGRICIVGRRFLDLTVGAHRWEAPGNTYVSLCFSSTTQWSRRVRALRFSTLQKPRRGSRLPSRRRRPDEALDTPPPWPAVPRYKRWRLFMCITPPCKRKWRTTSCSE